jgi:hypothetical protein
LIIISKIKMGNVLNAKKLMMDVLYVQMMKKDLKILNVINVKIITL